MTPLQHRNNVQKIKSEQMKRLSKSDNKKFGDFSGMKSSFKDESHTHEINRYMDLR